MLPSHEVHLWHASVPDCLAGGLYKRLRLLLSRAELQRAESLAFERLEHEYVVSRALCRLTLSRYASSIAPNDWRFGRNPWGRPQVLVSPDLPALDFNLAHSHGVVVMAVASPLREVGVDVEVIEPERVRPDAIRHCFSLSEQFHLERLQPAHQVDRFFELWSSKEAYVKARGFGLSLPLDCFSIGIESDRAHGTTAVWLATPAPGDDARLREFFLFDFPPNHKLAICIRRRDPDERVAVRRFSFSAPQ